MLKKENKNESKIVVKTFDGTPALKKHCKYYSNKKYYIKDKQCFLMSDGKWHRIDNGLIVFDHRKKEWCFKNNANLMSGIVDVKNKSFKFGYFTYDEMTCVEVYHSSFGNRIALNEEILKDEFVEIISEGKFIEKAQASTINKFYDEKIITKKYNIDLYYTFERHHNKFRNTYDKYFANNSINSDFYKELENITFGLENETSDGQIPIRHCYRTGLIPLIDGSLRHGDVNPYEYTTIPLQGKRGLETIKEHCKLLERYCKKNENCSLHIHVGNIRRTPEYIVSMYRTLLKIQSELYDLFPKYFIETSRFKATGKNYCNPLSVINFKGNMSKKLDELFYYYITGHVSSDNNRNSISSVNRDEVFLEIEELLQNTNDESVESESVSNEEVQIDSETSQNGNSETQSTPTPEPTYLRDFFRELHNEHTGSNTSIDNIFYRGSEEERPSIINRLKEDIGGFRIGMSHPDDSSEFSDRKWNVQQRYKHTNIIPLLFGRRGTVEFRLHTATFNHDKIINWLFIVAGICKFADKYKEFISKNGTDVTLKKIMKSVYSNKLASYLCSYIDYRVKLMKTCWIKYDDGVGYEDLTNDNLNKWNYSFKSLV